MASFDETIRSLRAQMREAVGKAAAESTTWNKEKERMKGLHPGGGVELRIDVNNNLVMKDALAGCKFHMEVATMYASVILAEISAAKSLGEKSG